MNAQVEAVGRMVLSQGELRAWDIIVEAATNPAYAHYRRIKIAKLCATQWDEHTARKIVGRVAELCNSVAGPNTMTVAWLWRSSAAAATRWSVLRSIIGVAPGERPHLATVNAVDTAPPATSNTTSESRSTAAETEALKSPPAQRRDRLHVLGTPLWHRPEWQEATNISLNSARTLRAAAQRGRPLSDGLTRSIRIRAGEAKTRLRAKFRNAAPAVLAALADWGHATPEHLSVIADISVTSARQICRLALAAGLVRRGSVLAGEPTAEIWRLDHNLTFEQLADMFGVDAAFAATGGNGIGFTGAGNAPIHDSYTLDLCLRIAATNPHAAAIVGPSRAHPGRITGRDPDDTQTADAVIYTTAGDRIFLETTRSAKVQASRIDNYRRVLRTSDRVLLAHTGRTSGTRGLIADSGDSRFAITRYDDLVTVSANQPNEDLLPARTFDWNTETWRASEPLIAAPPLNLPDWLQSAAPIWLDTYRSLTSTVSTLHRTARLDWLQHLREPLELPPLLKLKRALDEARIAWGTPSSRQHADTDPAAAAAAAAATKQQEAAAPAPLDTADVPKRLSAEDARIEAMFAAAARLDDGSKRAERQRTRAGQQADRWRGGG